MHFNVNSATATISTVSNVPCLYSQLGMPPKDIEALVPLDRLLSENKAE